MADRVGAQMRSRSVPSKLSEPKLITIGSLAIGPERIDDVDLPGADDAFVLVLGALQQRVMLAILGQFGKTRAPADIDEDSRAKSHAVARGGKLTLCAFLIALFFSICRQRFCPRPPLGSRRALLCQCSIINAASSNTCLAIVLSSRSDFPANAVLPHSPKRATERSRQHPASVGELEEIKAGDRLERQCGLAAGSPDWASAKFANQCTPARCFAKFGRSFP